VSKPSEPITPEPFANESAASNDRVVADEIPAIDPTASKNADPRTGCEPALLTLLVCPFTRTTLSYDAARQELISRPERLAFPIRDGIPILVREEARSLDTSSGR
jgi:uncharacterized protein